MQSCNAAHAVCRWAVNACTPPQEASSCSPPAHPSPALACVTRSISFLRPTTGSSLPSSAWQEQCEPTGHSRVGMFANAQPVRSSALHCEAAPLACEGCLLRLPALLPDWPHWLHMWRTCCVRLVPYSSSVGILLEPLEPPPTVEPTGSWDSPTMRMTCQGAVSAKEGGG